MFNLPFPTDSLYKFFFVFGIVLIIYGVYYSDAHLNKYDVKQDHHIIDSLKGVILIRNYTYRRDSSIIAEKEKKFDTLAFVNDSDKKGTLHSLELFLIDFQTYLNGYKLYANDQDIIGSEKEKLQTLQVQEPGFDKMKAAFLDVKSVINAFSQNHTVAEKSKLDFLEEKYSLNKFYYVGLLVIGFLLFLIGTPLWYFKIQKPQDELLKMQIEEAKKKRDDILKADNALPEQKVTEIRVRKHFEPQILPRPQVRNKI